MKFGPIEAILATPAMQEELLQKGYIEILCSEGFQTFREIEEQSPFWMNGISVRAIARNERATAFLLESVSRPDSDFYSGSGTGNPHQQ